MVPTRQIPASLSWKQSRATQRSFDLISGERVYVSLRFVKIMGTLAEVVLDGATYTFKRAGFLHPKITVRKAPFEQDIGVVEMSWKGTGTVEMSNGRRYLLEHSSAWNGCWKIISDANEVLAETKVKVAILRTEADVTVFEKGAGNADLLLLLALEWYIVALIQQESAAVAVST
jgi:hypothetical protein